MEPGDQNEIKWMKMDLESNGEDCGAAREPQRLKCKNPTTNTDSINDSPGK